MPARFSTLRSSLFALVVVFLSAARLVAAPPAPFTIVALPDTQFYSESYPATFLAQTQWIVNNVAPVNIAFVTHEGDITNDGNKPAQWANALKAMDLLNGKVPYATCPGNHNVGNKGADTPPAPGVSTKFPNYVAHFGPARYKDQPWAASWYAGASADGVNSAQKFQAGGRTYLALSLEFQIPPTALAFAHETMKANPGLPTIITTHAFLNVGGKRLGPAAKTFSALTDDYPQLFLILCGHMHGESSRINNDKAGQPVLQVLADYQSDPKGGNGYLRLLTFDESANKIHVKTYSPTLDKYRTTPSSQFDLDLNFAERFGAARSATAPAASAPAAAPPANPRP